MIVKNNVKERKKNSLLNDYLFYSQTPYEYLKLIQKNNL
jgi:hypothetical protein